jgi:hypothetical protein
MRIAVVATTMKEVRCMFATAIVGVTVVCKKSKVECNCGACNHYRDRGGFGMAIHH